MKQLATSNLIFPEKTLIAQGGDALRVAEFGGHPVPEDGLALEIPAGGVLTVWPDGRYVFEGTLAGDEELVSTYYSFVVDFLDGTSMVGSFSLGEQASNEAMPDFQAWSMDDIMALDEAVGLGLDMPDSIPELHVFEGDLHTDAWDSVELGTGGSDGSIDTLDYMIKTVYDS
jgi:hypothetical protein